MRLLAVGPENREALPTRCLNQQGLPDFSPLLFLFFLSSFKHCPLFAWAARIRRVSDSFPSLPGISGALHQADRIWNLGAIPFVPSSPRQSGPVCRLIRLKL